MAGAPIQIGWQDADEDEASALLSFLQAGGQDLPNLWREYRVRHAALAFYRNVIFCEWTDLRSGRAKYALLVD